MAAFAELERVFHTAPLGFRFFDRATAQTVADGLSLTETSTGRRAVANRAGVFVATGLPGLRDAEQARADEAFWSAPPASRRFTFELHDAYGRFHAARLDADAPTRGVVREELFSLPARPVPAGSAAVRAELTDGQTGEPAAGAVLEVSAPGLPVARGIADGDGRVLVLLPYPEPPWQSSASPPGGGGALAQQSWPVGLSVRYEPAGSPPEEPGPPFLSRLLTQRPATLESDGSPGGPVEADVLAFGRELVLNAGEQRVLLVTPAP